MAEPVEIAIGESFAERHQQFVEELGDDYEQRMRELIENEIHTVTQQLERQAEQQMFQAPNDLKDPEES